MLWSDLERYGRLIDPWRELERMNRTLSRFSGPAEVEFPAVNVWVAEDKAVVTTELPGVNPDAIEITASNNTIILKGSRQPVELKEGESYHRRERWHGQFSKSVELPFAIEKSSVDARFRKGILSISLSRAEAEKPRKIVIQSE